MRLPSATYNKEGLRRCKCLTIPVISMPWIGGRRCCLETTGISSSGNFASYFSRMTNTPEPELESGIFKDEVLADVDRMKHKVFAFVSATESLESFCIKPCKIVFQLLNDRTVYVVSEIDVFPEFCPHDFFLWLNDYERVCTAVVPVRWEEIDDALDHSENELVFYYMVNYGEPRAREALEMFTEQYFPHYL
ncbi:E4.1 protein [Psittacine adenovirus 3]|uniref:E4.1 protein n=1 Tax=Psittacine adenovirus 3 TaxID=1580497 RepID=A0A0A7JY03_9ADEN|nr:E4.1 protein [Psittacine adenovirus 3]AIZ35784.1 E4.1 protein [Psittacine adenovirus 3]